MLINQPKIWSDGEIGEALVHYHDTINTDSILRRIAPGERTLSDVIDSRTAQLICSHLGLAEAIEELYYAGGPICRSIRQFGWLRSAQDNAREYKYMNLALLGKLELETEIASDLAAAVAICSGVSMGRRYGAIRLGESFSFRYGDTCEDCGEQESCIIENSMTSESWVGSDILFKQGAGWSRVVTSDGHLAYRRGSNLAILSPDGSYSLTEVAGRVTVGLPWETDLDNGFTYPTYYLSKGLRGVFETGAVAKAHSCVNDITGLNATLTGPVAMAMTGPIKAEDLEEVGWRLLFGTGVAEKMNAEGLNNKEVCAFALSYKHRSRVVRMSREEWNITAAQILGVMRISGARFVTLWNDVRSGANRESSATWAQRALAPYTEMPVIGCKAGTSNNERERFWLQIERKLAVTHKGMWTITTAGVLELQKLEGEQDLDARDLERRISYAAMTATDHEDGDLWAEDRRKLIASLGHVMHDIMKQKLYPDQHMFVNNEMDWQAAKKANLCNIESDTRLLFNYTLMQKALPDVIWSYKPATVACYRGDNGQGALVVSVKGERGVFVCHAYLEYHGERIYRRGRSSFGWYRNRREVHRSLSPFVRVRTNNGSDPKRWVWKILQKSSRSNAEGNETLKLKASQVSV